MARFTQNQEYKDLLTAQRMLMADIQRTPDPEVRATLIRTLCTVFERKRILRMKPKPKDVDTTRFVPRRRSAERDRDPRAAASQSFSEPTPTPAEPATPPAASEQGISFIPEP